MKSAGILPYRIKDGRLEVFLGHFGGPFWKRKQRSWGIIKGEVQDGESDLEAAKREFFEETGKTVEGEFFDLGELRSGAKRIHIFGVQADFLPDVRSNMVRLEYRGKVLEFPEIDRGAWFGIEEARKFIVASQEPFLDRLSSKLGV